MPSVSAPRVSHHIAAITSTIQAGVNATPLSCHCGCARSTPIANTIIGTPTKWLTMFRRSR